MSCTVKFVPVALLFVAARMKRAARRRPFRLHCGKTLLADVPAAVFAPEPGAGLAGEAVKRGIPLRDIALLGPAAIAIVVIAVGIVVVVGIGIAADRRGRNGACGADRAAYDACRNIGGPEAGIIAAVPAVVVPAVMPPIIPAGI